MAGDPCKMYSSPYHDTCLKRGCIRFWKPVTALSVYIYVCTYRYTYTYISLHMSARPSNKGRGRRPLHTPLHGAFSHGAPSKLDAKALYQEAKDSKSFSTQKFGVVEPERYIPFCLFLFLGRALGQPLQANAITGRAVHTCSLDMALCQKCF